MKTIVNITIVKIAKELMMIAHKLVVEMLPCSLTTFIFGSLVEFGTLVSETEWHIIECFMPVNSSAIILHNHEFGYYSYII